MTALALNATVDAYPLGRPHDGTPRFGMTPEQATLYRWLVKYKPHGGTFEINTRHIATLFATRGHSRIHDRVGELVARGWLKNDAGRYSFVEPIMHYREPARG